MSAREGAVGPRAWALAAYAAPGVPEAMLLYCASLVVPGYYTEMGVPTKVIGTVMVLARLFDAAIDPAIGFLSDRTARALGSRRPWLVAGAVVSSLAVAFLYTPSPGVSGLYYLGWTIALYFGWTMAIIPYDAWGADISRDYHERARIFGFRAFAYYAGSLLFLLTPFLGVSKSRSFDGAVLAFNAKLVAILFAITVPLALRFAPKGRAPETRAETSFFAIVKNVRKNRPMMLFLAIYALSGVGLGMFLALSYIYVVDYLKLPEAFPVILLGYSIANVVAMPAWLRVIKRLGKHRAWAIAAFADAILYAGLAPFPPGARSYVPVLAIIVASGAVDAVGRVAADSILGDVIDYDQLTTGTNRAANYYAMKSLVTKANIALGGGAAFLLIGLFGYDPKSPTTTPLAAFGFLLTFLFLPSAFNAIAALLMWRFPITASRQSVVKRRLDARARRLAAAA